MSTETEHVKPSIEVLDKVIKETEARMSNPKTPIIQSIIDEEDLKFYRWVRNSCYPKAVE